MSTVATPLELLQQPHMLLVTSCQIENGNSKIKKLSSAASLHEISGCGLLPLVRACRSTQIAGCAPLSSHSRALCWVDCGCDVICFYLIGKAVGVHFCHPSPVLRLALAVSASIWTAAGLQLDL
jgi:hypothetical protein